MTNLQKIQKRQSEVRVAMADISALEGEEFEGRAAELGKLQAEWGQLETRYQAAVVAGESPDQDPGAPENRERTALEDNLRVGPYLQAALESRALDGREREYSSENKLADNVVPWAALAGPRPVEERADVSTSIAESTSTNADKILARVFQMSAAAFVGVSMRDAGTGDAAFPVITGGHAAQAGNVAAGAARADAAAMALTINELQPRRLQGAYRIQREDLARIAGLESEVRMDLSNALNASLDYQTLLGSGAGSDVEGFFTAVDSPSANPGAEFGLGDYMGILGGQLDGRYASMMSDVRVLVGPKASAHLVKIIPSGTSDTCWEKMSRVSGGLKMSGHVPAYVAANKYERALTAKGPSGAAVCPTWGGGLYLIRDEVTRASQGEIVLNYLMLWNFQVLRAEQYSSPKIRDAA